ncbi:MAG: crotonyl-CoA carboxylase/reductase [Chloroflexi bacterium]|nr:crotonyl-CoA carboxylase/reductase [Chloroflexota bacterium]
MSNEKSYPSPPDETTELKEIYPVGEHPPLGYTPPKMYAWVIREERFGEPLQAFQVEAIDTPEIGDDEVLVYVMAAGVNYNNVWAGLGVPVNVIKARQKQGEKEDFHIGGSDASGIVYKVGKNVKNVKVGDEVVIHCGMWDQNAADVVNGEDPMYSRTFRIWGYESNYGSFAQFTRVQDHQCLPKPKHLTWEEAAAYMLVGATSYRMLHYWRPHDVREGDVVLVWGGAGGLGSMAIQIARAAGAKPIAVVSSEDKYEYCMSLGAIGCINRKEFDHWGMLPHWKDSVGYAEWLKGVRKFGKAIWELLGERKNPRIVFEHPGEYTIPTSIFVVDTGGMVVICAGTTGFNATVDLRYLWMRQKRLQGSHFANDDQAKGINDLVIAGKVDPCLSRTFAWNELPDAHQLMYENKHPYGNMAILVGAPTTGLGKSAAEPAGAVTHAPVPTVRRHYFRAPIRGIPLPARTEPTDMDEKSVRELMHYGVISVSASTPVTEVARRMAEYHIHAIVVTDEQGFAIGLVSQTDIIFARQGRTIEEMRELTAADIMTRRLITCSPDATVSDAVTLMTRNRIHRLVVVDERKGRLWPVGIISMTDIINYGLGPVMPGEPEGGVGVVMPEIYEPSPPKPSPVETEEAAAADETTVREVMHYGVITCQPDTPVGVVAQRMLEYDVSTIIVIDERGYLDGIITQTDIVLARQRRRPEEVAQLQTQDIYTPSVLTCTVDTKLSDAITHMTRNRVHRLVVVEEREEGQWPVGIVSMSDIVRHTIAANETR